MVNCIDQADPDKRAIQRAIAQTIADASAKFQAILSDSLISTPTVAAPAISPEGGTYTRSTQGALARLGGGEGTTGSKGAYGILADGQSVTVSLACVTDGATIYYTTDGTVPTAGSAIYTQPFAVADSAMVRAIALKSGYEDSSVSSAGFAFLETPQSGSFSITVFPAAAVNSGAQWRIDAGEWLDSGHTATELSAGSHTIAFKPVSGWVVPDDQSVTVSVGQTTFASGTYAGSGTRVINLSGGLAFGSVVTASTTTRTMAISNNGSAPLTVTGINYPAGFSGDWIGGVIASGDSRSVTVTFAPTAAAFYGGTVTVNCDNTSGTNTITASGVSSDTGIPSVITDSGRAGTQETGNTSYFTYSYRQLIDADNLNYTVGVSDDLLTWDWTEAQIEQVGTPTPTGDGVTEEVTVRLMTPMNALPPQKFFRLKVTLTP